MASGGREPLPGDGQTGSLLKCALIDFAIFPGEQQKGSGIFPDKGLQTSSFIKFRVDF